MSERAFMICECGLKDLPETAFITESELKRRLDKILQYALVSNPYDELFDLLLHGEGKEEPCKHKHYRTISDDVFCADCGAYIPNDPILEQPQSDPWEAWVEEMPYDGTVSSVWQNDLQKWFRKMPRGGSNENH